MKVIGTITRVREGQVGEGKQNAGQPWQAVTIEGMQLFVPLALQNGWQQGQRVRCEVAHQGSKRIADSTGKVLGFEQDYHLLGIELVKSED